MPPKRNRRKKKKQQEQDVEKQPAASPTLQPVPTARPLRSVSPMEKLRGIVHDIAARAEANQENSEERVGYFRGKLGYGNENLDQIEMDLRIKDDNDELNDLESELLNEIELLRHEQGLSASLTELDSGMSEFGRPPRSISRDSFDECIKNLISLQELIEGHPKHREELNEFLDDDPDVKLFKRYFFDYSGAAIRKARLLLQDAFDEKLHQKSQSDTRLWKGADQLWRNNVLNADSLLETQNNDRTSYSFRHNVYTSMNEARDLILNATEFEPYRQELDELYSKIRLNVKDFVEHTRYLRTSRGSTASLAHIPVSRRSLHKY